MQHTSLKTDDLLLDLWNRIREKRQSITKVSDPGRHDKKEEKVFSKDCYTH